MVEESNVSVLQSLLFYGVNYDSTLDLHSLKNESWVETWEESHQSQEGQLLDTFKSLYLGLVGFQFLLGFLRLILEG